MSVEEDTFATFNGLGYTSMVMGIPLVPLLVVMSMAFIGTLVLFFIVGKWALIYTFVCGIVVMGLKILCENDNKALDRLPELFNSWLLRFKKASPLYLVVTPNKKGSKDERFLECIKKINRTG